MAPNINFFEMGFTRDSKVVTNVGIKLMHNLSNIPRDVANG